MNNLAKIMARNKINKDKILSHFGNIPNESGIYVLTREENNFRYAYIGQAVKILERLASHLNGYQHIDLSLKKHGLYSYDNPNGWSLTYVLCPKNNLDKLEQQYILEYAKNGYQLRNKTSGSQGEGKKDISDRETKGYIEGLHKGYLKARKDIAKLFSKNLVCCFSGDKNPNKNQLKAMNKFKEFINIDSRN